jgi:hypothetical protein
MIRQSDTILTKAEFDIISQPQKLGVTVACIIVRHLLISVHKWQFPGMADTYEYCSQHDAHQNSIFTNFSWAKSHNFFIMQKSKFTEIFNIC